MLQKYREWIDLYYPTPETAYLACQEATARMQSIFPELKRCKGLADVEEPLGLPPTRTPHWWLVDSNNEIIDPTAHQYPTRILKYEKCDDSKGTPTGRCPNCGGLCYNGEYICSIKCCEEYAAYLDS